MSEHLRISIVTPSLNQAQYLEETILSVLEQGYPDLEYIVIDGGSTVGFQEIIRKYQDKLHYWISEPDDSMYEALAKGFEQSSGQIMGWINSDDKYHPGAFEIINELFLSISGIHWIQGVPNHFDEQGRCVSVFPLRNWSKYDYYCRDYKWIPQESTFWTRELWTRSGSGWSPGIKYAGDLELWLRFFRYEKLYSCPVLTGGFRIRSKDQISLEMREQYLEEANSLIDAEISALDSFSGKVLKRIQRLSKLKELCRKFRIMGAPGLLDKRIRTLKDYPPPLYFERISQSFKL